MKLFAVMRLALAALLALALAACGNRVELMAAMPERSDGRSRLATIPGMVPGIYDRPVGCLFAPRCGHAQDLCRSRRPTRQAGSQDVVGCHFPLGQTKSVEAAT